MNDDQKERRRYFRIEDEVYLEVQTVAREEYTTLCGNPPEESDHACDLILQLRALTSQAGIVMAGIRKSDPEVAQYLSLQDKKIDLIARALVGKQLETGLTPNAKVNVSAGGVAFHAGEAVAEATPLRIRLVFFPSHLCVQAYGMVVHCDRDDELPEKPYNIGVEFTVISDVARDALVRHTLAKQSAQLRERRGRD